MLETLNRDTVEHALLVAKLDILLDTVLRSQDMEGFFDEINEMRLINVWLVQIN